ncbi:MAG: type II toxin-antitoxin system RelE/ParE family toxin [Chlamydiota bacterium]
MENADPKPIKVISVEFYRSSNGKEPVRDWIKSRPANQRKIIGQDIKTVEMGWPIGMPIVKSLGNKLWEVRSNLIQNIARVIFILHNDRMVLLHGFIKKAKKQRKKT